MEWGADVCAIISKNGGTFIPDEDGADSLKFSDDRVTGFSPDKAKSKSLSAGELTAGVIGVVPQGINPVIS